MMDLHILIVIACVFLASLFSLLFINKFLRRKTFEEIIAEKKALTEKIYGKEKNTVKKPKKISLKKEMKREKKQRAKEQQEDSDAQSEQPSVDDEPQGLSKTHVEFEPDAEVLTYNNQTASRRSSNAEKENINKQIKGNKKDKKANAKAGILVHKNDAVNVKEAMSTDTNVPSNHFDVKTPKDAVELKKSEKKDEKSQQLQQNKKEKVGKKSDNRQASEKTAVGDSNNGSQIATTTEVIPTPVVKEVKQLEEKVRQNSPKTTQQKNKQNKKQKDAVVAGLEKLSESDTVGVSLLMNLFRRAELNRSEIQILIDYLLNRQQDMPSSHSEWSDDICQKLKRQLEEKEKALAEEQEASIGIQAKLRELRTEINTERATMGSTIKSYVEKLQTKDQDIALLEQKIKTLNDTLTLERQQFQAKLMHEKQTGSQDIMAQLQIMQNELSLKDKCISDLTCIVNASRQAVEESQQKNEIIQTQAQQMRVLEQQRDELEQVSNNRIFEMEKANQLEAELNEIKLELRNTQNALESARSEKEALKNELSSVHSKEVAEKQQEIETLQTKNSDLTQQLMNISSKTQEQSKEQNDLQTTLNSLQSQLAEKQRQLDASEAEKLQLQQQFSSIEAEKKHQSVEQAELQKIVETLKNDVSTKTKVLQDTEQQVQNQQELQKIIENLKAEVKSKEKQLQENEKQNQQQDMQKIVDNLQDDISKKNEQLKEAEKQSEKMTSREKELMHQLQEQKEKNNQQEKLLSSAAKTGATGGQSDTAKDQKRMRDLFQRLCPEASKACAGAALSVSFDQWVEQVLSTHIKQQQVSSSHKSTQSTNSHSPSSVPQNSHANGSRSSSSSISSSPGGGDNNSDTDRSELLKENSILRIRIDELTKLARKTEYTLSDLMQKAEEQEEHWRSVVRSKDEQINTLQYKSNGQQGI